MAIRGSLEIFSLPELFQIIESGRKSGKLTFTPIFEEDCSKIQGVGVFDLWFDKGNFVVVVNSMNYQKLITDIKDNNWIDYTVLIKTQYSCPQDEPFGTCLQEQKLSSESQINSLFEIQLDTVRQLFKVDRAWFKFEEIDRGDRISEARDFPWKEMTGKEKRPAELSIEAMRDISNWQRFEEDLPTAISGLRKLNGDRMQLTSLEEKVWNYADGTVALKTIAQEASASLEEIQRIALSMILAGIVEEVPMAKAIHTAIPIASQTAVAANSSVAFKPAAEPKVSNSLINNLVSFLKNNF